MSVTIFAILSDRQGDLSSSNLFFLKDLYNEERVGGDRDVR